MSLENSRKLDAVVDAKGRIVSWRCTDCNWTKLPEKLKIGPTKKTQDAFEEHSCADHKPSSDSALSAYRIFF